MPFSKSSHIQTKKEKNQKLTEKDILRLILKELMVLNARLEAALETQITEDDIRHDYK